MIIYLHAEQSDGWDHGFGDGIDTVAGNIINELSAAGSLSGSVFGFGVITSPIMMLFIVILMGYAVIKVFFRISKGAAFC